MSGESRAMRGRGQASRGRSALLLLAGLMLATTANAAEMRGKVTDGEGKGIAEAVVFIEELPAGTAVPEKPTANLDQVDKEFVPHILPVVVGTEVFFPNHDQIHHHVYAFSRTKTFETPLYKGETEPPVLFDKVGAVKVGCNIHDWMSAVILVLPTPYFALTDPDGAYVIRDVPDGKHSVAVWHERSRENAEDTAKEVSVGEKGADADFALRLRPTRSPTSARAGRKYR